MSEFITHSVNSAPAGAQPLLQAAQKDFGFVPNLLGVFAQSPVTLEAYLTLNKLFDKSSFSKAERQVILLSISRFSDCCYCLAAHGTVAKALQVPTDILEAIHYQQPLNDPKLDAIRTFTVAVLEKRGWVDKAEVQEFYQAGFMPQQVLEIILAISFKTLSNYVNHINDTEIDSQFIKGLPDTGTGQHQGEVAVCG